MRKYKHWLVLDMTEKTKEQATELINELVEYQRQHGATIELFHRNSGTFEDIFSLECSQCYNDLDLPCNAGFNSFYRLQRKPSNIHRGIEFEDYLQRYGYELV